MKIGIFGDSFAALKFKQNPTPTWVDILQEKFDITNFAVTSSNLYYSVNKFKEEHEKFDKIIFVATVPGRLQLPDWIETEVDSHRYATNLSNVECELAHWHSLNEFEKKHLGINFNLIRAHEAARNYYAYLDNEMYNNFIQKLMIDEVCRLRDDTVMIPVEFSSFGDPRTMPTTPLSDVCKKELRAWNETIYSIQTKMIESDLRDFRNCHLTAENNAILAEKVEEWLSGALVQIRLDDFATPTNKEFYIRKL
jgi:hypothetical protein